MGRVIAFPDMKSRLQHLPAQSGLGQKSASNGSRDNVVLFGGVFVEYHDKSQKMPRTNVTHTDLSHPLAAQRSEAGWHHRKKVRPEENYGPEQTPRLKHR